MKNRSRFFSIGGCVVLILLLICVHPVFAAGIGIGPARLEIDDAIRGGEYEQTITIFNPSDNEIGVNISTSGTAGEWVRLYQLDDRNIPVNEVEINARENLPLLIMVDVPADAGNGVYNAKITAVTTPVGDSEGITNMGAVLKAAAELTITVTGIEQREGTVESILVEDTEAQYPLPIKVRFRNTGNVIVTPEIRIEISRDGAVVDSCSVAGIAVKPNSAETMLVERNTFGWQPGTYRAEVTVFLDGNEIAKKDAAFEVKETGSLSRQGELSDIRYDGEPVPGTVLKIVAVFSNTGDVETRVKLVGEVMKDGVLVDTISSEELAVPAGGNEEMVSYLEIEEPGEYHITAHAVYDGKKTGEMDLSFSAATLQTSAGNFAFTVLPVLSLILAMLIIAAGKCRRK